MRFGGWEFAEASFLGVMRLTPLPSGGVKHPVLPTFIYLPAMSSLKTNATTRLSVTLLAAGSLGISPALHAANPAASPRTVGWLARARAATQRPRDQAQRLADLAAEERAFHADFLAGRLFAAPVLRTPTLLLDVAPAASVPDEAAPALPAASPLPADFAAAYSFFLPAPAVSVLSSRPDVPSARESTRSAFSFAATAGTSASRSATLPEAASASFQGLNIPTANPSLGGFAPAAPSAPGLPAAAVAAATSGTLTSPVSVTYSTAPWVITSGTGTYPDGGGVATINSGISATPGTLAGGIAITVDVSPTLSGITYNSPFTANFAVGAGTSIVAATTGLTLNGQLTAVNTPTSFILSNSITSPISGGGTAGVTKTGTGIVTLGATNTYTGGTHINGGELVISAAAAIGDNVFGATGAGNGLSFNGGSLFNNITGGLTSARPIFLDTGGALFYLNTAATLSGVISGPGSLNDYGFAAVAMTLTGPNTYTGATITSSSTVSALTLSGSGSINTSSSYDLAGTLTLTNSTTTGIDRLNNTGAITSHGVLITTTGNATTASAETAGALILANGNTTINVTPGTAGSSLNFASLTRQGGSTLFVRGTTLGNTPGAGVATITAGAAPTLLGGAGAAGSTTISIVPWILGNLTANISLSAANTAGSSLVTYDATNGFRPLATAEYATALGVSNSDNVRLTAATAATAGVTANALLFAPAAIATLSGGPINLTSGTFAYSPTVDSTGTVSAGLNFGSAEGVVLYTSALGISGTLTGSGGLTVSSPSGAALTLSGANTYTGTTTLVRGTTVYTGPVANDGVTAGPFGLSTTPITLNPGTGSVLLYASAANTFARDLLVTGTGPGLAYFGTAGDTALTMSGNINLQHNLLLAGGASAATALVINGTISGPGMISDAFASYNVFNGNNTFTGGLNIATGIYVAGSDTAFGTGPIYDSGIGFLQGSGTATRTVANNIIIGNSGAPTFQGTTPLNFTGTVFLNGAHTFAFTNTALTAFSGVVSSGALTTTGTGAVALNSPTGNTFTGGFINTGVAANASAIYANNTSGSAFGPGSVSIGAASATVFSTLAGNFTVTGPTSIAGRLSPGNGTGLTAATAGIGSIGTANFGALTLSSSTTSSLYLEIGGTPASGTFDKINVSGLLTLAGTVNLATTGGYTLTQGSTYDLVDWGTITPGAVTFSSTNATFGTDANGVSLYFDTSRFLIDGTVTVVPEPATVLGGLLTAGLLGLGLRRRLRAA